LNLATEDFREIFVVGKGLAGELMGISGFVVDSDILLGVSELMHNFCTAQCSSTW
jgi:hypothetical protein